MASKNVKIVVFVPEADAEKVRMAMGKAGAGRIGNYSYCSFSSHGTGRFLPGQGAQPHIGTIGKIEAVTEERIETVCERAKLEVVVRAMEAVHPYEEVAYEVYAIEDVEVQHKV